MNDYRITIGTLNIIAAEMAIEGLEKQIEWHKEHPLISESLLPGSTETMLRSLISERNHWQAYVKDMREALNEHREVVDG